MHLDTINQTFNAIGTAPFTSLSVPYISYRKNIGGELSQYAMKDVFEDYGSETAAHNAFVAMLEKSECPLVKASFVKQNLDELELFSEVA
jgi:hypothetical protein